MAQQLSNGTTLKFNTFRKLLANQKKTDEPFKLTKNAKLKSFAAKGGAHSTGGQKGRELEVHENNLRLNPKNDQTL